MSSRLAKLLGRKERILIATPCYDNRICTQYAVSMFKSVAAIPEISPAFVVGDENLIRVRNDLFAYAYTQKFDQLVWIDADQEWSVDNLRNLIDDKHDFVTGLYRKKQDNVVHVVGPWVDPKEKTVLFCGMGFCKMSRKVVDTLWKKSWPYTDQNPTREAHDVFGLQLAEGESTLGEDVVACGKWPGKIYLREDIAVGHIGQKVY